MPPSPVKWPKHGDTSKEGAGGRKSALRGSGESAVKVARMAPDDGSGLGSDLDSDTAMSPPVVQVPGVDVSSSSAEGQHPVPTNLFGLAQPAPPGLPTDATKTEPEKSKADVDDKSSDKDRAGKTKTFVH